MANEWTSWKEHGITKDTPDSILFGAGTIHQGLEFSGEKWNFAESIIGATNGGSKLSMKPEVQDIEVDGKFIKAKGLMVKVGESATMEINFAEINPEIIKKGLIAGEGISSAKGYKVLEGKPDIEEGDYFENFAFVGRTVSKKPIIVVFDYALCTSGFELDPKHKSQASSAWETIKNIITVGIMLIASIISAAVQIITLPWRFIWENCKEYIIEAWDYIKAAVSSALGVISSVISNAWNIIANYLTRILSNIKNKFVSEWNAIKSHVSSAINGIKSSISNGLNGAKSTVTGVLNSIRSAFSSVWDGCKNIVGNAIGHIKSLMNFSWSLPSLKLPHFSISGKFSLHPPSVPKLGIEWYKKAMDDGMIMNQPTIFGYNAKSNQFLAGGEAGSETVVGTQNLMDMIQEAVNNAGSGNGDSEATRALLEAIFNWMRNGGLYKLLIDVLTNGVEFEFDNREIARLVKKYA